MTRTLILALLLASSTAHAALRPRPTNPTPSTPTWPVTGGGSPTVTCAIYPLSCVQ
jgi:hypothetical protein